MTSVDVFTVASDGYRKNPTPESVDARNRFVGFVARVAAGESHTYRDRYL